MRKNYIENEEDLRLTLAICNTMWIVWKKPIDPTDPKNDMVRHAALHVAIKSGDRLIEYFSREDQPFYDIDDWTIEKFTQELDKVFEDVEYPHVYQYFKDKFNDVLEYREYQKNEEGQ